MCCCGFIVGSCLYKTVSSMCGCTTGKRSGSLIPYLALLLFSVALAIIFRYSGEGFLKHLYYNDLGDCTTQRCLGYGAVFRISFATFFFFITHGLLLFIPACVALDRFSFGPKILYWLGLLVCAYLLPEGFYADFYVHVSRVVAGGFLFLQIVILIDFAHSLNESWNSPENAESEGKYKALILIAALLALIASGAVMVLCFIWFGDSSCHLNLFFISFTIIITILLLGLSIAGKFSEHGGILPGAIVTLYCWWLCYSGLASDPSSCNSIGGEQETTQLIVGLVVAAASISYAGWNVGTHKSLFGVEEAAAAASIEEKAAQEIELGKVDGDRDAAHARAVAVESAEVSDTERLVARRNVKFHLMMACCSMYMAMLLTNWGSTSISNDIDFQDGELTGKAYDLSKETVWIKFVSQWVTMLLYGWSLLAPVVCKGRDFS